MSSAPACRRRDGAFTLVELLVVIGIIALLISILLPALNSARRQANAVKCASQLREIGNCFTYYANDNRGYFPPARMAPAAGTYTLDGFAFDSGNNQGYWYNFINRYVTKNGLGRASGTDAISRGDARNRSIIWGCPTWDAYAASATDKIQGADFNTTQTGFGFNEYPTYTSDYPAAGIDPPQSEAALMPDPPLVAWSAANPAVGFMKASIWRRHGAERMLISDARLYIAEARAIPATGVIPNAKGDVNSYPGATSGETTVSFWRHSKLPASMGNGYFKLASSKVAYNIAYCDGHVVTSTDPKDAYRSIRMKFPG